MLPCRLPILLSFVVVLLNWFLDREQDRVQRTFPRADSERPR